MKYKLLSKFFVISNLIMLMILLSFSPTPINAQELSAEREAAQPPAPFPVPLGTAFTYQGHLSNADGPVTASCDMTFQLFSVLVNPPAPNQFLPAGEPQTKEDVDVNQGAFNVTLDFGESFGRLARWLKVTVDCGDGPVELGYQPVYAVPFALYAKNIPGHNHLGETWDGSEALTFQGNVGDPDLAPLVLSNSHATGDGLRVLAAGRHGLQVVSAGNAALDVVSAGTNGVFVASAGNTGIYVGQAGGHGVYATTTSAANYGGQFNNRANGGVGLYAEAGDGNTPDLVLGGNNNQEAGDNGRIASDPRFASSDIFLTANDAVVVTLDNDGQGDDASDFEVRDRNGNALVRVSNTGAYRLSVNGSIRAKEIVVETGWSDFVFEDGYELLSLQEVEAYIDEHGHLPGMPSAAEVAAEGVRVGEIESRLLQKVEELTLYLIALENRVQTLEREKALLNRELELAGDASLVTEE